MSTKTLVKRSEYHDSVTLMLVARELAKQPGVQDAAVVMGTDANKGLLRESGLLTAEAQAAGPNDLVIVVSAADGETAEAALAASEGLLRHRSQAGTGAEFRPKTLRGAVKATPGANVAVISVAGRYAADEAWDALRHGLHVLLFSDNVAVEDEVALKRYARDRGLLLMGPGAGTAILNGVALGFANVLPSGPVGIVSAAGTGLQEVTCLLARQGVGITQGIGTGARDMSEAVGGLMMIAGLKALQDDPATQVITLVSKPPAPSVAGSVLSQVAAGRKPAIVCFLGGNPRMVANVPNAVPAVTLEEAASLTAQAAGADGPSVDELGERGELDLRLQAEECRAALAPGQRYLRGLFSGGTLCYEAQVVWRDVLNAPVHSNAPLDKALRLKDSSRSEGHTAVDLGEEEFTVGRPHPMIDNDLRIRRLLQEARDAQVAVILLDVVLGYGAHPDPAGELGAAVLQARKAAQEGGRELLVVASVTGTADDPQDRARQVTRLEAAGVVVCPSNAAAAQLAGAVVGQDVAR